MTYSLLGIAAKLASVAVESELAIQAVVEDAAGLVQETAKNAMGTYEFGWTPLKEETVARKATGDSPLLETGELRDSIEKTIGHHVAWVGSDSDKAVWHEFGTSTIPPRSFIASAGMVCEPQIHELAVETIGAVLGGHSAASALVHAAKEAAHVWRELGDDLVDEDKR